MIKTVHIIVSGRVQGVCYRASTQKQASKLKLAGWVRNLPDGRVEIQAQGEPEPLEQLIAWCRRGPTFARVDHVTLTDLDTLEMHLEFIIA